MWVSLVQVEAAVSGDGLPARQLAGGSVARLCVCPGRHQQDLLGSTFSSVELFDVRADRWRSAAPMTNARCYGAAVVHNGEVSTPRHCAANATLFPMD